MIEALDLDLTVRVTGGEVRLRVTDADLSALNDAQRAAVTGSVHQVLELLLRPVLDTSAPPAAPEPVEVPPSATEEPTEAPAPTEVASEPEIARLTAERDALARWKAEAMPVLAEWDEVYVALGEPGALGESKARASRAEAERLRDVDPERGAHTTKQRLLDHLLDHGPVEDRHGDASIVLYGRGEISGQKIAQAVRELVRDGLIVRRGNATKTYGLALADDADALDELLATPAPEAAPAAARRARPPRDTGPAIEGRSATKEPPTPAVTPVAHQGYQVLEVIEETDIDVAQVSEDDRRQRATAGAWPGDFLA